MSCICLVHIDPPVPLFSSLYTRNYVGFSADSISTLVQAGIQLPKNITQIIIINYCLSI
jgi:hypothetical protein